MLGLLATLLLALHLLAINVCSAGPLLCVWLNRKQAPEPSRRAALALAWDSFWLLPIGIAIGLILGVIEWQFGQRDYANALAVFHSKVTWGIAELACSLAWTGCYWAWLRYRRPQKAVARWCHATLAVLSATNLLYHFPPLMTVMSQVTSGTLVINELVDAAAHRSLVFTPLVMAQTMHIWMASIAVSGVYLFWLARGFEDPWPVYRTGARAALVATAVQMASGLWMIVVLPRDRQSLLLGEDSLTTLLLFVSLLATFSLLQQLAAVAFGDQHELLPKRAAVLMLFTVVCMTGVLYRLSA